MVDHEDDETELEPIRVDEGTPGSRGRGTGAMRRRGSRGGLGELPDPVRRGDPSEMP
jgi:hypothetical protein